MADYYITKSFRHDFLVAAIRNLISQRKKVLNALFEGKKTIQLEPGEVTITSRDENRYCCRNGLTGLAPIEFVREMRLKRAKQMLDAGTGNISEIAYT